MNNGKHILHMANPADCWENATPVGNGKLGLMLAGSPVHERLRLNEETIWAGGKKDTTDASFRDKIDYIRQLFLEGKPAEADEWAKENMSEAFSRISSYEYAGELTIDYEGNASFSDYGRDLDLINGIVSVSFKKGETSYVCESFADRDNNILVWKIATDSPVSFSAEYNRENISDIKFGDSTMSAGARTATGNTRFSVAVKIITDGSQRIDEKSVRIENSTETVILIGIASSFVSADFAEKSLAAVNKPFDYTAAKEAHCCAFSAIMSRSDIYLEDSEELSKLSVAERLQRLREDGNNHDFGLLSLYYTFGKYLLISSSIGSSLPANLQGVWAEKLENPWNADYHTNINLQMNYWQAEEANISECTAPLFNYMNDFLLESGKRTAAVNYKVRGTVLHHLSDIYGFTTPADGLWGLWPLGGAWLAYSMWEHYLYTRDKTFLRNTAYEYIRQCTLFFLDYMFEDENGRLLSGPSTSPENCYYSGEGEDRKQVYLCISPTMDIEIIGGLFRFYIETENILHINEETKKQVCAALSKMPPLSVGKHGQLMEWLEDYDEPEPGHRHISHAFALYPDNFISRKTPELFSAIKVTLERRLASGGGHTGWSRAWLINLFARLKDGENTYKNIVKLFTKSTNDNLFDSHPPFQIDGNFGGAAGIGEALMQSHEGFISILPAVTDAFSGGFRGLKARGNVEVSAEFKKGIVDSFTLSSPFAQTVSVELPRNTSAEKITVDGKEVFRKNGLFEIELTEGKTVHAEV